MSRYPLRASGVVPRTHRHAPERNRGRFTQAVPAHRRRSVRAWVAEEALSGDEASLRQACIDALGPESVPLGIKREGYLVDRSYARIQFCGLVPA